MNSLIVRVDGTLAPCFPMYNASYDWGTIENHKFERKQLTDMKQECQKSCFSTLNHILAFCYNDERVIKWLWKHAKVGFREWKATLRIDRGRFRLGSCQDCGHCKQALVSTSNLRGLVPLLPCTNFRRPK